jgi:competence protein ComEC
MKSSALRALTMAAVYFLAPLFRRKPDIPNAIAFAAILLLFFQPLEILSAGFIFSFTVVSFIVMAFSAVPKRFVANSGGWIGTIRTYVASLGITSAAAFVASIPLTALFFGSFSSVSLVGNLVVVPLTFCIVLSGWLSLLIPIASGTFNHAATAFINGLLATVGFLSALPGASWNVPPPPLLAVLAWYVGWIHLFTHARTAQQRIGSLGLVVFALVWATLTAFL